MMIKPASSMCNMDCGYCFYHDLAGQRQTPNYGVMAGDTVRAVVKRVFEDVTGQVHFTFQGGEPLLAGKEFFREFERA
ncbi:MAG: 4Fe-4S cluster-binding domain-containing protein, partial [Clostridia bacterium]|nr:4Fe-4S cluster-binding domain-containing protein [Clostridia bacterium]